MTGKADGVEYSGGTRELLSTFPRRWFERSLPPPREWPHGDGPRTAWIKVNIYEDHARGLGGSNVTTRRRLVDLQRRLELMRKRWGPD